MENNFPEWGPRNSPEFGPIIATLTIILGIACACAIFPIVASIVTIVFSLGLIAGVGYLIMWVRRERKLDWEAMYGPLTEEEKEHANDHLEH